MANSPLDSQHTSVSASITLAVLHAASRMGLVRNQLMRECGLDDSQLSDPDARVPFSTQERLWQALSRMPHGEPGLALGSNLAPGPFSVLGYLLQSSPTLGDALAAGLRYQRLVGEGGEVQLHEQGDELQLLYRPLHPDLPAMRCVGYRQAWAWLDAAGAQSTDDFREHGVAATRQLAKRQLTWLRSMPQRRSVACDAPDALARVLALAAGVSP